MRKKVQKVVTRAGFFRVNYDMRNWMLLARGMSRADPASRASAIDDAYELNRAGKLDTWLALYFVQSILGDASGMGERDIAPWLAGAKVLRGFAAAARADPATATYFQQYVARMVTPAFQAVGWENEYDQGYNRFERRVVRDILTQLACDAGLPECRRKALRAYADYAASTSSPSDA